MYQCFWRLDRESELEELLVTGHPRWVLETELMSPLRAAHTLY